ncbi:putative two-component system sensor histidine kinase [Flavobacterium psychrophilum]|uniref:sensor histidine kinase n=1 Tax=Flavobacterium psychrophilum TaxID=96345 RepID=UPI000B7C457F|nr:ATP-binding protein [Flavobacterium psychrophilum]SNB05904.1 putative two-component system sensor histidine kinase [Flavobacterium psychrophilum]SNB18286.1 putative two-component system sensor histidine kinase [Flavobacterium psychrophilum]GEJ34332.1 two-component sensor histidine kinase [Flavobacterium psychrophilum]GEJ34800.1 two-component sensor histidine kinase [Flavobacterium psychrophilum]GEJ35233.1 two-component sensor histidine kinase [Flavobacterium psychrophilum]
MNSLLKRQIDKKLKNGLDDIAPFINAVNDSYNNFEDQISMLQRAMKISSDELFLANQKLRDEAKGLKEINKNLQNVLNSMNLENNNIDNDDHLNSADYVKQQSDEIIRINKQREELLKNLEKQNQALYQYAHVVSHDLKAPLRSIDTLINWFKEDNAAILDDNNNKSLDLVLSNVEKMDLLIKGILDYSAIDKLEVKDRTIDLNILIHKIIRTITIPNHIEIILKNKMPKIVGNDITLKQLFQNLIQNAIKYNDKEMGFVEIGSKENDNEIEFYIKDNGIGIKERYQDKIFNLFSKLENTDQSSGIGLSIVKKIIDLYQGKIWLESQETIGTTFYFTIPKQ